LGKLDPTFTSKPNDSDYLKNGFYSKFSQFKVVEELAKELEDPSITAELLQLNEYGFYYVPNDCTKPGSNCTASLVLQGSGSGTEDILESWLPYASANNIVVIAPQTYVTWDSYPMWPDNYYTGDLALTRKGPQNLFLKKLIEIANQQAT
jgi:hypothetical protein